MEFKLVTANNSYARMLQQSAMSLGTMSVSENSQSTGKSPGVVGQAQEI